MLYRFDEYALDTERRELRLGSNLVPVAPQVFDLIEHLIDHRDHVVSKEDLLATVWGGRLVSESALTTRINAARHAIGDDGELQRLIRTIPRKGFRFVGDVQEVGPANEPSALGISPTSSDWAGKNITALRQDIRYSCASDGVRLAFAKVGNGPRLLKAANYLNHLEYDWESPVTRHLLHGLAGHFTLLRYDARGNGLSDREVPSVTFEDWVTDLEAVADAAGWDRFPLLGMSQGCAVSIAYAVRHPERVSHLVLYGSFARGRAVRATNADELEKLQAMKTLIRIGWGEDNPAFRQLFTSLFVPGGSNEQLHWFNELQRVSASPECATRYFDVTNNIDIRELLPQVRVPTLVMHLRDDAVHRFEFGREVAAAIPGARFVPLQGRNHMPLASDPAAPLMLEEIERFLNASSD